MNFEVSEGHLDNPVIVHVPHASTRIPDEFLNSFLLDGPALEREATVMADLNTDTLAIAAANKAMSRPWLFINRTSRLVFDPERFDDDSEVMNSVGMGVVYTKTSDQKPLRTLSVSERQNIVKQYFDKYSEALQALVARRLDEVGRVTIIDLHSYATEALPYELNQHGERPAVCLGVDVFHTSTELEASASKSFESLGSIAINTPFAGTYVPLKFYQTDVRVESIMLEIRKDTYDHNNVSSPKFDQTADAIATLISSCQNPSAAP